MISVENFYWVLYEQLLRPSGMHANYFSPFGTTSPENIVIQEYSRLDMFHETLCSRVDLPVHLAFFYDQEPLNTTADSACVTGLGTKWFKSLRVLANSEHSEQKQQLLKEHRASDWYYFYHGFAALDWFRDARYLDDNYNIRHAYLSLNHLVTSDRSYRMALTARLADRNLLKSGLVSFHAQPGVCQEEIYNPSSKLSTLDRLLIKNNQSILESGLRADHYAADGNFSAHFGHFEYKLLQSCFLHVVNETVFYHNKLHLTEKVFKPIVTRRPFVLTAAPGNLAYLKSYGFRTFDRWIDETYDTETNHSKRLNMIVDQVERITRLTQQQQQVMHKEMQEVLQHNYHHFFGEFRKIITKELVLNFEKCVRVHNNGRVDQRVANLIDYDQACGALLA